MPIEPGDWQARPAAGEDLPALAEVYLTARQQADMPPPVHDVDAIRGWVGTWELAGDGVWLVAAGDRVAGLMRLQHVADHGDYLSDLYVHPDFWGQGIGQALVALAQSLRPEGLRLWVFDQNRSARRLYERAGFHQIEHSSDNEERAPAALMAWRGSVGTVA